MERSSGLQLGIARLNCNYWRVSCCRGGKSSVGVRRMNALQLRVWILYITLTRRFDGTQATGEGSDYSGYGSKMERTKMKFDGDHILWVEFYQESA